MYGEWVVSGRVMSVCVCAHAHAQCVPVCTGVLTCSQSMFVMCPAVGCFAHTVLCHLMLGPQSAKAFGVGLLCFGVELSWPVKISVLGLYKGWGWI